MFHRAPRGGLLFVLMATLAACGSRAAVAGQTGQSAGEREILARAKRIHLEALTIDTHVDIAGPQYATPQLDPGVDNPRLQCDLEKMEQGGVDAVFLAVFVGQGKRDAEGYKRAYDEAIGKFTAIHRLAETMYPDRCELAMSPDDVERIVKSGKRAVMIGVENGHPIGLDLANVKKFYDLGARYITLSHNGHNQICDSCNPNIALGDEKSEYGGLSQFGREVVAAMNRLGVIVDVSHISRESFFDVVEASRAPVIASHSGCSALRDHSRNLDDQQLKALAKNGGVIQVVAVGGFLRASSADRRRAIRNLAEKIGVSAGGEGVQLGGATSQQRREFRDGMREVDRQYPPISVKDYVNHIDHAVKTAGIDHVGIGSDFDGGGGVADFNDHSQALNVTVELVRRGYTERQIKTIWGGNILRVWRDVEETAKRMALE